MEIGGFLSFPGAQGNAAGKIDNARARVVEYEYDAWTSEKCSTIVEVNVHGFMGNFDFRERYRL